MVLLLMITLEITGDRLMPRTFLSLTPPPEFDPKRSQALRCSPTCKHIAAWQVCPEWLCDTCPGAHHSFRITVTVVPNNGASVERRQLYASTRVRMSFLR